MEPHEIVAAIRQQNWKNGGALVMDTDEAEALVANAIAALEQRVRELERANSARSDYDLRCQECGRAHIIDTSIPSDIWNQIAEPGDVLCAVCIDSRLAAKGLTAQAEFYYTGAALNSRLYAESHGEVQAAEREAAALREENERLKYERDRWKDVSEKQASWEKLWAEVSAERDALLQRVAECEGALEPFTFRISERIGDDDLPDDYGIEARIPMREVRAARQALSSPPSPVSALIEAGRLACEETKAEDAGSFFGYGDEKSAGFKEAYRRHREAHEARRAACAAIIAKEK